MGRYHIEGRRHRRNPEPLGAHISGNSLCVQLFSFETHSLSGQPVVHVSFGLLACTDFDLDHTEPAHSADQPLHQLLNLLAVDEPQAESSGHLEAFRREDKGLLDA